MQDTWEPGLLYTLHTDQLEAADMGKLTKILCATAVAGAMPTPCTAAHPWGGPRGGGGLLGQQLGHRRLG
jgi:hypothetical protein